MRVRHVWSSPYHHSVWCKNAIDVFIFPHSVSTDSCINACVFILELFILLLQFCLCSIKWRIKIINSTLNLSEKSFRHIRFKRVMFVCTSSMTYIHDYGSNIKINCSKSLRKYKIYGRLNIPQVIRFILKDMSVWIIKHKYMVLIT